MPTFQDRLDFHRRRIREAQEAALRAFVTTAPPKRYIAEEVVEGKTVAEWAKLVAAFEEAADDRRRETGVQEVLDLAGHFPASVPGIVARWRAAGMPTEYTDTAALIAKARAEAEKHAALATMEDNKVADFDAAKDEKHAEQHRRYAKREKLAADRAFAEVERLTAEWKKEHP